MDSQDLRGCAEKLEQLRNRMQLTEAERAVIDDVIKTINEASKGRLRPSVVRSLVGRLVLIELWRLVREHLD